MTGDEPMTNLGKAKQTLRSAGVYVDDVQPRGSFAFVIYRGDPEKTVFRKTLANTVAANTKLDVTIPGTRCSKSSNESQMRCNFQFFIQ